uniref:Retrovirus-related Pol polyprotein from transposon TNT 1-94-like beta-barrel domain-containing protein n=1 Tax=Brassica oleracea TaxID=3712 RepID=A0A3P6DF55_BRAOL|nr:unnamed protein product [Brassica oleracea]
MSDLDMESQWIVDYGFSLHLTWKKGKIIKLDETLIDTVKMGNDPMSKVMGKGSAKIVIRDGC